MSNAPAKSAEVAALVGDPARANMLVALLGGRALTATELAYAAGVSAANHQRPSQQALRRPARRPHEARPPPLLSPSRSARRPYAGKHHACRDGRAAALPAALEDGRIRCATPALPRRACKAPGVLPSLSRLDGAALPHRRRSWCSTGQALLRAEVVERARDSRALTITPAGRHGLMEQFALSISYPTSLKHRVQPVPGISKSNESLTND